MVRSDNLLCGGMGIHYLVSGRYLLCSVYRCPDVPLAVPCSGDTSFCYATIACAVLVLFILSWHLVAYRDEVTMERFISMIRGSAGGYRIQ